MVFARDTIIQQAAKLAEDGVYLGASSWKYQGWLGRLYTPDRYVYRGKMAKSRFEKYCLSEYAEVFKPSVWTRPTILSPKRNISKTSLRRSLMIFGSGFKVTDAITVKKISAASSVRLARRFRK